MFSELCHAILIQTSSKKEKELINVIFSSKLKEKFEKKNKALNAFYVMEQTLSPSFGDST